MNSFSYDFSIDHPHFLPEEEDVFISLGSGAGHRNVEYESNNETIDEQVYKFNDARLNLLISLNSRLSMGVIGQYDFDREYELKFGPGSESFGDDSYNSNAQGLLDPELVFVYQLKSKKSDWNKQLYLSGNPFDIKEEPKKIYRGGHDIFVEYRFSHKFLNGDMYGKIFSHYFGEKNFYLPGDSRLSNTQAYTEVGLMLGYLFKFSSRWSFFIDSSFGLSSDYVIQTPEVERSADKGYILISTFGLNLFLSKSVFITVKGWRSYRSYNSNQEEIQRNIGFEIEDYFVFTSLSFSIEDI